MDPEWPMALLHMLAFHAERAKEDATKLYLAVAYVQRTAINDVGLMREKIEALELHVQFLSDQVRASAATEAPSQWSSVSHARPGSQLTSQAAFLDAEFWQSNCALQKSRCESAPPDAIALLGDLSDIALIKARYFSPGSAHTWMPIISQIRLDRFSIRNVNSVPSDIVALLLCMKLVQEVPATDSSAPPGLYFVTKRLINEQEMSGILTFRLLQANILLSVYELGHGIFPNAYMTVGHCARSAVALGIHNQSAPQLAGRMRSWIDLEERQRAWWMIIILDR
ncbi:hypothetical protein N7468_009972 [Penicillium chermesinum]|uniref:Xylanolytic transcriptional activator regulatory domain-containing protein n=1 Tax=Penicillium chermesinum TaxID=63820 RepID=A0A9W9TC35_9EURO|nr:uncharacterized protein N7468_009972 [Penicillium chermesinum]KAJ5216964.1 hypothetical protein N7468_009972 [Penicillium chermesinum]KAJ6171422.1 hypothetical protein N7470_000489 [Penicillium chermesinum]